MLWRSGLPQIAHIIFALALALHLLLKPKVLCPRCLSFGAAFALYALFVSVVVYPAYPLTPGELFVG